MKVFCTICGGPICEAGTKETENQPRWQAEVTLLSYEGDDSRFSIVEFIAENKGGANFQITSDGRSVTAYKPASTRFFPSHAACILLAKEVIDYSRAANMRRVSMHKSWLVLEKRFQKSIALNVRSPPTYLREPNSYYGYRWIRDPRNDPIIIDSNVRKELRFKKYHSIPETN